MSDEIDSYLADLEIQFGRLKALAELEASKHNAVLADVCACGNEDYVQGLVCKDCGYCAPPEMAYRVVESDEFGYRIVALGRRGHAFATYHLDTEPEE